MWRPTDHGTATCRTVPAVTTTRGRARPTDRSRYALAALMGGSGVLHFALPNPYESIVPGWIGHERAVVHASGLVELACAGLLANRSTRRSGAWLTLLTLVGVYPANIQMALDAGVPGDVAGWAAWLRLPLQFPLFAWAWRLTRS